MRLQGHPPSWAGGWSRILLGGLFWCEVQPVQAGRVQCAARSWGRTVFERVRLYPDRCLLIVERREL